MTDHCPSGSNLHKDISTFHSTKILTQGKNLTVVMTLTDLSFVCFVMCMICDECVLRMDRHATAHIWSPFQILLTQPLNFSSLNSPSNHPKAPMAFSHISGAHKFPSGNFLAMKLPYKTKIFS